MATNPYVNKVVVNNQTLIDLTADTVDAAHLAQGYTAHDLSGAPIVGTMVPGGGGSYFPEEWLTISNETQGGSTTSTYQVEGYLADMDLTDISTWTGNWKHFISSTATSSEWITVYIYVNYSISPTTGRVSAGSSYVLPQSYFTRGGGSFSVPLSTILANEPDVSNCLLNVYVGYTRGAGISISSGKIYLYDMEWN